MGRIGHTEEEIHICCSEQETIQQGIALGRELQANNIVCFTGDLGAGKTTFIKGVVMGAAHIPAELVNSPTYVYLNVYSGEKTIYHFDLYRLRHEEEFLSMGFEEMFFSGGICCIEWSERISNILPEQAVLVSITHTNPTERIIKIRR